MVGHERDRRIAGCDGVGVAPEVEQRQGAIVVRRRMAGRERQSLIKGGECRIGIAKYGMGQPAIDPSLGMLRRVRQNILKFGKRLARTIETQKHIGVLVEDGDIGRRQRAGGSGSDRWL